MIINNEVIGKNPFNSLDYKNSGNSIFSKIGNDVIGKGVNQNKKKNKEFRKNKINDNIVQNVIEDLMETTKEKFNSIEVNNDAKIRNFNMGTVKININNQNNNNAISIVEGNENAMFFNSQIWEILFEIEISYDNKSNLNLTVKRYINLLQTHVNNNDFPIEIFSNTSMNNGYSKIIKICFILVIYLKFILSDFNYDTNLKSNVKTISNSINDYLIQLISHFILTKGTKDTSVNNCNMITTEFLNKYTKILKLHKNRNNPITNPTTFGNNLSKSCEIIIGHIRQMSNNFFKLGYFKPIHSICYEFFRLLETYSPFQIANLIINHVLFFLITEVPKSQSSITNKTLSFNPNNILSLYGFNGNIPTPFLPSCDENTYTLVLDLDETLVHFFYCPSGGSFLIRPYCYEFLRDMSDIFEIAIFTAAMQDYADGILDKLDPNKIYIKYRLYRQHTSISGISFVKDLTKLGRDLSKVIIIDNLPDNFKLQPHNGLAIKTWLDEMKDTQLNDIGQFLKNLIAKKPNDIRPILQKVKEEVGRRMRKNNMNPFRNILIDKFIS